MVEECESQAFVAVVALLVVEKAIAISKYVCARSPLVVDRQVLERADEPPTE